MHYCLVTPTRDSGNPGHEMITAGIRHWLKAEDPGAHFSVVNMLADDPPGWERARRADRLVFCGNPRFNSAEEKVSWDWGVWERILHSGVPFIDAWAGSAVAFDQRGTAEQQAALLKGIAKNQAVLRHEARAERLIARDRTTELLFREVNPATEFLPCSSRLARYEFGVEPGEKEYNAIVLRELPGEEWVLGAARRLQARLAPCHILVTGAADLAWAKSVNPLCISDPLELLKFYARVKTLHSLRIHSSIPAHSLGAEVIDYAIDSRADTLEPFDIQSLPYTAFGSRVLAL